MIVLLVILKSGAIMNYNYFSNRLWLDDVPYIPICGKYTPPAGLFRKILWYLLGKPTQMMKYKPGLLDKMREKHALNARNHGETLLKERI